MFEYYFIISDKWGTYDFVARFSDHMEATKFIEENEREGGKVICKFPFFHYIPDAKPFEF